ncbi:insulinase family protein [uncultured Paraglaciecola sp.]|uniref:insulinase family protein n=1 Tax=uncultured Paraglaciecola sp. TaxID=1765024 RepID=UPI0025946E63|nr:insulinase family protein [uncultured Paraglaciecola sp.]
MISTEKYKFGSAIVLSISLLISACGAKHKNENQQVSSEPEVQHHIVKSPNDNREYTSIVLDNDLQLLLVSDPDIEKSAVALSVAVGSFQEPKEFGGLAHYLEHMLFMGTKSYPEVGGYGEFVTLNGGTQNAYTELDHTNFMVAVNNEAYDQALSRFSGFFYEALLNEEYADKERNAVHSEWTMKSPNDWVILAQLEGKTLNPEHPISQFNWGNLESLKDSGNQKLQDALLDFYNRYYSANLMKAAMISNLSIAEMKLLAKRHFSKIPNKHTPKPTINVPVATAEQLKKIVHYVPQADMKQLSLHFVIENNAHEFAVKPNGYVNYLMANEMPGTLASELRDAGFSEAVYSTYEAGEYGSSGSFILYIDLTETGVQNRDKVMGAVVRYLRLLREQGVNPLYFNEIKQSLSNDFRFKEKTNDYNYAMQISANLQHIPTEYVLSSEYEYQRFNAVAIQNVLNQLTLDNARVFYIDKAQPADIEMKYFAGKYSVQDITDENIDTWRKYGTQFHLSLPRANTLMPENFDLAEIAYIDKPKLLVNEKGYTVHLGHSALFKQPKGRISFELNSGFTKISAKNHVLASLLSRALSQQLIELQSEAGAAGMGLNTSLHNGLSLTVSGFTDKQGDLVTQSLQQILSFDISAADLDNIKASFISDIESSKKQILLNQLFPKFSEIVNLDGYSDNALLAEVNGISPADLKWFREQLLKKANLRVFAYGNYTDKQVKALAELVLAVLPDKRDISEVYQTPALHPLPGSIYSWKEDLDIPDVGLIDAYLTPLNSADLAAARVLSQLIRPALFKQIRTEEQLAYAVNFFGETWRDQMLFGFYIQSPAKGLVEVHERIELFRKEFVSKLAAVTPETFTTTVHGILVTLNQPAKNLSQEMAEFIEDWRDQKWTFDSKQRLIKELEKVTLDDVIAIYKRLQEGAEFGRVLVQMRGHNFADKNFIELEGSETVTNVDVFHQALSN